MSQWFDPRLMVFVIWGVFVVLFICLPSRAVGRRLCRRLGCVPPEPPEAPADPAAAGGDPAGWEAYASFSSARKQELDGLRASVLSYRLYPCSLVSVDRRRRRRPRPRRPRPPPRPP